MIGQRHIKSGEFVTLDNIGVPHVRSYSFQNLIECRAWMSEFPAKELEGVVVVDSEWRRVKIKTSQYIQYRTNPKGTVISIEPSKAEPVQLVTYIFDAIRQGTIDDVIGQYPEMELRSTFLIGKYKLLLEI
eukprot:Lithocolla_globosa_v1_NODE_7801_length_899_cov_5.706161.p1 type:complete len:131 gc:universal NODE_7801_length_899_cov_5.706161:444-836(+)